MSIPILSVGVACDLGVQNDEAGLKFSHSNADVIAMRRQQRAAFFPG
jgi:hypothetical protein